MQISARTYLIAGVAVASTGVIAAAPVVAPTPLSPVWLATAQPADDTDVGPRVDEDVTVDVGVAPDGINAGNGGLPTDPGPVSAEPGGDGGLLGDVDEGLLGDDGLGTGDEDVAAPVPDVDDGDDGLGTGDDGLIDDIDVGDGDPAPEPDPDPDPEPGPDDDGPLTLAEIIRGEIRSGIRVVSAGGSAANDVARVVIQIPARVNADVRQGVSAPDTLGGATNDVVRSVGTAGNRVVISANGYIRPRMDLAGVTTRAAVDIAGRAVAGGGAVISTSTAAALDVATAPLRGEDMGDALDRNVRRVNDVVDGAGKRLRESLSTAARDITRGIRKAQADPASASRASAGESASNAANASSERAADD